MELASGCAVLLGRNVPYASVIACDMLRRTYVSISGVCHVIRHGVT